MHKVSLSKVAHLIGMSYEPRTSRDHTLESLLSPRFSNYHALPALLRPRAHCRYKAPASSDGMGVSIPAPLSPPLSVSNHKCTIQSHYYIDNEGVGAERKEGMNDRFFISSPLFLSFLPHPYFTLQPSFNVLVRPGIFRYHSFHAS